MEKDNFMIEFIRLYRTLTALWDINSNEYKDKRLKNKQYAILLEKFKEKYPNAEKRDLAQKINSMRTSYRKQRKRMKSVENDGSSEGNERQANMFYYDEMSFLQRNEEPCTSHKNKFNEFGIDTAKRRRKNNCDDLIALATRHLQQGQSRYEKLAEAWAVQLEEMDPHQRIFAEKFINDILFEGKMGTLHRDAISFNVSQANTAIPASKVIPPSSLGENNIAIEKSTTEMKEEFIQDEIDIGEEKVCYHSFINIREV